MNQVQKHKAKPEDAPVEEVHTQTKDSEQAADLLDEIDGVLEKNYREFVKSYVQKVGE